MKRLFAVFTLCAAMAAWTGLGTTPAAADGRSDSRQHRQERYSGRDHDRSAWRYDRGQDRQWARKHYRMHRKFRRHQRQHRHSLTYRLRHKQGHGHVQRHGSGYGLGPTYALRFDGGRFILRLD